MKTFKKIVSSLAVLAMVVSLSACNSNGNGNAGGGNETGYTPAEGDVKIKFSWWGGDSRHTATMEAVKAFEAANENITVEVQYAAWSGWEESMASAFSAGNAPDVNQINWNWITSFSSDGSKFVDLNLLSDYIDLTQFNQSALDDCTLANKLQAIPVAMTGRIFYWNASTFEKAGISVPNTYAELLAAGETFKTKLGDDYYPLVLGEYDRMILMVYYLESVYGKAWVVDGAINYTQAEIEEGLEFINKLEEAHVIPSVETITGDGADSLDKNKKWMEGTYAGIFEWDSSASKFEKALNEGQSFVVGNYFSDFGNYQGGYSKVSLAFAISETTPYKVECAKLINFLLNEEEGIKIMATERGIPLSKTAFNYLSTNNLLNAKVAEANQKVLDWVSYPLDPKFEDAALKTTGTGVYYEVFQNLSYKKLSTSECAKLLMDGVSEVLMD